MATYSLITINARVRPRTKTLLQLFKTEQAKNQISMMFRVSAIAIALEIDAHATMHGNVDLSPGRLKFEILIMAIVGTRV